LTRDAAHSADVLVIGGGLAGCWAAIAVAEAGGRAIIAEKGWCGTSGVAATAGPGHWFIPPEGRLREEAVARRLQMAQGLGDAVWMTRILDRTWTTLPRIGTHYHHVPDDSGRIRHHALRGPEYLRALREKAIAAGVCMLDHSPALELLADARGAVTGARGVRRQGPENEWRVHAGAVVLASGGCAFRSSLLGAANNTGDGLLMAVEAGAVLSGMEFSAYFTVAPAGTPMARTMIFAFARYRDARGRELPPPGPGDNCLLARALADGPVLCDLSRVPDDIRAQLPQISPNVAVTFRRLGIDPFTTPFPVTLIGEGTIRGTGGVRVADASAGAGVPGLYVAGDVASREPVTGAVSGGGAVNAAWALASGCIAGEAALVHARSYGPGTTHDGLGRVGLTPGTDDDAVADAVRMRMLAPLSQYDRNSTGLRQDAAALDDAWRALSTAPPRQPDARARQRAREVAAMTATARWVTASAVARNETRGMHRRTDTSASLPPSHVIAEGIARPRTHLQAICS